LRVADLEMDLVKRTVARGGRRIDLQPQEFKLLEYLMRHAYRVVISAVTRDIAGLVASPFAGVVVLAFNR
jgi:DNA-binding response OmpR family regulator